MKIAFTISTCNYLYLAKAAAQSFLQHNEDYRFTIYLFDKVENRFNVEEFLPCQIVEIESLGIPEFNGMLERYSVFEMCNALKPFLADHIFSKSLPADIVVYIDSDVSFYNRIEEVEKQLVDHDIIFTPHILTPHKLDGHLTDEISFLQTGIYNGGFFALRPSVNSSAFLEWWKKRMELYSYVKLEKGLFVDQIWLNFVPVYFTTALILRDVGYNIGHWNLHERAIMNCDGRYFVNSDLPLVFFHFSGYHINEPNNISKYQTRYTFDERKDLIVLFENYRRIVLESGFEKYSKLECHYSQVERRKGSQMPTSAPRQQNGVHFLKNYLTKKLTNFFN